ncbi:uncharacterized protein LOC143219497 [Lasioglossum baleicum]|uniref:uncharacterized protein LOC143219497 n=1 Tax=Lasioglossum baleicum TaxID=434251 RepID=UPI003FCD0217
MSMPVEHSPKEKGKVRGRSMSCGEILASQGGNTPTIETSMGFKRKLGDKDEDDLENLEKQKEIEITIPDEDEEEQTDREGIKRQRRNSDYAEIMGLKMKLKEINEVLLYANRKSEIVRVYCRDNSSVKRTTVDDARRVSASLEKAIRLVEEVGDSIGNSLGKAKSESKESQVSPTLKERSSSNKATQSTSGEGSSKGKSGEGAKEKDAQLQDLFKDLKTKAGDKIGGIQTIRKSRAGDLLIELRKDTNSTDFEKMVKDSLRPSQQTKRLVHKITYEIRDIDPTLEKEELRAELASKLQIEVNEVEIRSKRYGYLEGHSINECQNERRCILCAKKCVSPEESAHVTGAVNCPQFKKLAHDLVYQSALELGADVVLISEPLRNPGQWIFTRNASNAAIWVTGTRGVKRQEDGDYSKLEKIENLIIKENNEGRLIIIGGDFNAKSPAWGSRLQSTKGTQVLEMLLATSPELQEGGNLISRVLSRETASDHRYILTEIQTGDLSNIEEERPYKWRVTPVGVQKLGAVLDRKIEEINLMGAGCMTAVQVEEMVHALPDICEEALEKSTRRRNKRENIWWNDNIERTRKEAQKQRRLCQRVLILKAKEKSWTDLCDNINDDVWGKPYKSIMRRVKGQTPPPSLSEETSAELTAGSSSQGHSGGSESSVVVEENVQMVTREEILRASNAVKTGKAAGPDGIPPEAIKAMITLRPDCFVAMSNGILKHGIPTQWKRARTVLLRKQGKDPATPSSYRPICIIDAAAKLLEYVLKARILNFLGPNPFRPEQYGFCKGKSTTHAMEFLKRKMEEATKHFRFAAVAALDVKNAFNSLKWERIIDAMRERKMPEYLVRLTRDYFRGREVNYLSAEGQVGLVMRKGVPQGSVLGPLLWNLVYDGLLRKKLPPLGTIRAFADDIVILVQAFNLNKMKTNLERIIEETRIWMEGAGLELAEQKTELMMANRKRLPEGFCIRVGTAEIAPAKTLKYLGITFDNQKIFIKHIECATNKTIKAMTALSNLMRNNMKTSQKARKLFYLTTECIVLYGAPIWSDSIPPWDLKAEERKTLFQWENLILGFQHEMGSGRYVDNKEAATSQGEEGRRKTIKKMLRRIVKERTHDKWQAKWDVSTVGRRTHQLIPNTEEWNSRKHGQLDFYLTQALTGHGVFNVFRHRIGKAALPECWYHQGVEDDPDHTFIQCNHWEEERARLAVKLDVQPEDLSMKLIIAKMLNSKSHWRAAKYFFKEVLQKKEEEERTIGDEGESLGVEE